MDQLVMKNFLLFLVYSFICDHQSARILHAASVSRYLLPESAPIPCASAVLARFAK